VNRDVNDPRIVEVIQSFYRWAGSHTRATNYDLLDGYMTRILGFEYVAGDTGPFLNWPDADMLAVLTTYLQHAPEEDLDATVDVARVEVKWLLQFEHTDAIERATGEAYDSGFDYQRELAGGAS